MKRKILSDQYWNYVEKFITLIRPIVNWITILESDTPRLSVVPEVLNEIKQHFITYIPISPLLEVEGTMLLKKIDERYNMAIHPIHFAANLVDPNYQGKNLKDGCDVEGILFLKKVAKVLLKGNEYDKVSKIIKIIGENLFYKS